MVYSSELWREIPVLFFGLFLSVYSNITNHLTLTTGMECTLPELLYLGKETIIKINKIISSVLRECLFTASSDVRLESLSMQWELLLHPLGTYSVDSLLQASGMLKFMSAQCAVKQSQGKKIHE